MKVTMKKYPKFDVGILSFAKVLNNEPQEKFLKKLD